MTEKTILVLGAQGVLGQFTARALQAAGYRVLRGGRRREPAEDFRWVDLDVPGSLSAALQGVDLVVSSIEDPEVRAELEILRQGGVLLSQATIRASARRHLQQVAESGARGTLVLNSGFSGVGALVARQLLEEHPQATSIELGYIISAGGSAGLAGSRYIHRLLATQPRLRVQNRKFPAPRGVRPCFDLSDNDEIWLSSEISGKRLVQTWLAVAERPLSGLLRLLNKLGLLARLPQAALTAMVRLKPMPSRLTCEPMRSRIALLHNGQLLVANGVSAEGDYNSTVQSTGLFVRALLDQPEGAWPPGLYSVEDLFRLEDLRSGLEQNRILVQALAE